MNEKDRQLRDEFAARCTTEADRKTLARYDRLMRENRAAMVKLMGEAPVRAEEERESRLTDEERNAELSHLLRLLD